MRSGHIGSFIFVGFIFFVITFSLYAEHKRPQQTDWPARTVSEYRVESVYRGSVQLTHLRSGRTVEVRDPLLVEDALKGRLKKGDIIRLD